MFKKFDDSEIGDIYDKSRKDRLRHKIWAVSTDHETLCTTAQALSLLTHSQDGTWSTLNAAVLMGNFYSLKYLDNDTNYESQNITINETMQVIQVNDEYWISILKQSILLAADLLFLMAE